MDEVKPTTSTASEGQKPASSYRGGGKSFDRGGSRGGRRPVERREKPEFDQKILSIRRVTRVVSGGRRFSFSVTMLVGDKKGRVGLGLGKSADTTLAINKAVASGKKHMITVRTTPDMSISHSVEGKFKASRVMLMPNKGKGLVVGGAIRDIIVLAGLKNITGKIFSRSKTHLNNAKAAMNALQDLKAPKKVKVAAPAEVAE